MVIKHLLREKYEKIASRWVNFNQNTELLPVDEKEKDVLGLTYSPTVGLGQKYLAPLKRQPVCPKKSIF